MASLHYSDHMTDTSTSFLHAPKHNHFKLVVLTFRALHDLAQSHLFATAGISGNNFGLKHRYEKKQNQVRLNS
jgi:hypothetical protein